MSQQDDLEEPTLKRHLPLLTDGWEQTPSHCLQMLCREHDRPERALPESEACEVAP